MTSKSTSSASGSRVPTKLDAKDAQIDGSQDIAAIDKILSVIESLKMQVAADRVMAVKHKIEENNKKLGSFTDHLYNLSMMRSSTKISGGKPVDLLAKNREDASCTSSSLDHTGCGKQNICCLEDVSNASTTTALANNLGGRSTVRPVKLPEVQKLPPYTTWIFLDRNQRMTEDQSVVGRRRIYYDQNGGEALICSDSEDDVVEEEEEKREFRGCEDYVLRMTIQEVGLSDLVLESLAQQLGRKPSEIKERYESLLNEERIKLSPGKEETDAEIWHEESFAEKDLEAALDSFDNLFCRRCLVFDCRLHGCSQDLVLPSEKQLPWSVPVDDAGTPCGTHCYLLEMKSESTATASSPARDALEEQLPPSSTSTGGQMSSRKKGALAGSSSGRRSKSQQTESASSTANLVSESSVSETRSRKDSSICKAMSPSKIAQSAKSTINKKSNKRAAEKALICLRKRQKKLMASDSDSVVSGVLWPRDMKLRSTSRKENSDTTPDSPRKVEKPANLRKLRSNTLPMLDGEKLLDSKVVNRTQNEIDKEHAVTCSDNMSRKGNPCAKTVGKHEAYEDKVWKTIEKSLFAKGVEIFGKNSCLIARNVLNGLKTCAEVAQYIMWNQNKHLCRTGDGANSLSDANGKDDCSDTMGTDSQRRSRFLRRRGRVRRLKYTWKSAGLHSIRKRMTDRKDQPCRQYTPCSCQSACGKQCSCLRNGTCCEKYCGCPKSCKNRFRGCHCAKSQCRSRQCPCFAADRECDPDVCRNCWVGCGDGMLGGPPQRGDNYECRNMKLLLKQQQRVLLGPSDISGWGAFLKNSVNKHEYLGEYTGELISHREADKRGKIYDRENSSFLFNLNDQFVLDAYRKGDKLKFANHSPDPNCYAKVIMVAGDHRVGIFAKERICGGEELFYDYRYEPDRAPAWAKKPECSTSKKEDNSVSQGRAKKLA
ncbi:histone-lysine N-methyltransferase CLF isoform X1 [Nymphaea colorata]|nr:histone-lysine N-methyltransferase CLF isoform X1 [Nymphaea colorata]